MEYSFDRFSVLVVEDNYFLASLLLQSLKALGVGNIRTCNHAGEAIELLQMMKQNPSSASMMSVDVIFSNWQMSPVDGFMLLRWVRRHKDSPNRFAPFVMVTAYADKKRVGEARDMGVTEMLAKPFSVTSLARILMEVVEYPRHFVHTPAYFGPDRRRKLTTVPEGQERRYMRNDDVEVLHD